MRETHSRPPCQGVTGLPLPWHHRAGAVCGTGAMPEQLSQGCAPLRQGQRAGPGWATAGQEGPAATRRRDRGQPHSQLPFPALCPVPRPLLLPLPLPRSLFYSLFRSEHLSHSKLCLQPRVPLPAPGPVGFHTTRRKRGGARTDPAPRVKAGPHAAPTRSLPPLTQRGGLSPDPDADVSPDPSAWAMSRTPRQMAAASSSQARPRHPPAPLPAPGSDHHGQAQRCHIFNLKINKYIYTHKPLFKRSVHPEHPLLLSEPHKEELQVPFVEGQ